MLSSRFTKAQSLRAGANFVNPADSEGSEAFKDPHPELSIYVNLKASAAKVEAELRQQLEHVLEPEIFNNFIRKGYTDQHGRYAELSQNKNDSLYFYQHALNLLINFQLVMDPVFALHETLIDLVEKKKIWQKAYTAWSESEAISQTLEDFEKFYRELMGSIKAIEFDTLFGNLPSFNELKAALNDLAPVQVTRKLVEKNPFFMAYKENSEAWREVFNLPPAKLASFASEEDEVETEEEFEEKDQAVFQEMDEEKSLPELPTLLPDKVDRVGQSLAQILVDLSDSSVSDRVRMDYKNTAELIEKIFKKITLFSQGKKNWFKLIRLVAELYPLGKSLMESFPQSLISAQSLLKEQLLITFRQCNLIIRECFLYADHLESRLYLKDGLLLGLEGVQQGCALFWMGEAPDHKPEQLNALLGKANDGYILTNDFLYYVNRFTHKRTGAAKIQIRKLTFQDSFTLDNLINQLCIEEGFLCKQLELPHLQLIRGMTGHARDGKKYDPYEITLSHFARDINNWLELLGYEFKSKERFPYADSLLEQRVQKSSNEEEKSHKKAFLERRVSRQLERWVKQENKEKVVKQSEKASFLVYRRQIITLQLDQRIAELRAELNASWISFTSTKRKKITLLQKLKAEFAENLQDNYDTVLEKIKNRGCAVDLLEEGRTGNLMKKLRLVTSDPSDRIKLIEQVEFQLEGEVALPKNYWFFTSHRLKQVEKHLAAVQAFKAEFLEHPRHRVREILDRINAKTPDYYAILIGEETKLLKEIQAIDDYTPDFMLGKKVLNVADEMVKKFEAERRGQKKAAESASAFFKKPGAALARKKNNRDCVVVSVPEAIVQDLPVRGRRLR